MAGDIPLSSNFEISAQKPLDEKTNVLTIDARNTIPLIKRYDRMIVAVQGNDTYQLKLGTVDNDLNNNANWVKFGAANWNDIEGKPTEFTPVAHTHAQLHEQNTDYQIINSEQAILPGTNEIIQTASGGSIYNIPLTGEYLQQTFRNEEISPGVYAPAFNRLAVFICCSGTIEIKLYRGEGITGELLSEHVFVRPNGNGSYHSFLNAGDVIIASPLELFTFRITSIVDSPTGRMGWVYSSTPYLYTSIRNGQTLADPAKFYVKAVDIDIEVLGGSVITSATNVDITANNIDIYGNTTIKENLIVEGDIVQQGAAYETHAEQLFSTKDMLIMREGAVAALQANELSGFRIFKYNGVDNIFLGVDALGVVRVGDENGTLQALATREDNPLDGGFAKWNNANFRFECVNIDLSGYALTSHTHDLSGYALTNHNHNSQYLGITAKAADSQCLGGIDDVYFRGQNHGSSFQDPDLSVHPYILTNHANSPSNLRYWHIRTQFYNSISSTGNRSQIAIQYNYGTSAYIRSYHSNVWTAWERIDNNATDILTKLETVDGSGSGLDADKLDGQHASSFLRSNIDDTISGKYCPSVTKRSAGMYGIYNSYKTGHIWSMGKSYKIPDDGSSFGNLYGLAYMHQNLGIGYYAGGHQMVWVQNGVIHGAIGNNFWTRGAYYLNEGPSRRGAFSYDTVDNCIVLHNNARDGGLRIYDSDCRAKFSAQVYATDFIQSSDRRLKKNIKKLKLGIDGLKPVSFKFKNKKIKGLQYGFIAQDMLKTHPELVSEDDKGMLSIKQNSIIALLVKEVQDLKTQLAKTVKTIHELSL